jgi:hypothetical protein
MNNTGAVDGVTVDPIVGKDLQVDARKLVDVLGKPPYTLLNEIELDDIAPGSLGATTSTCKSIPATAR